MMLRKFAFLALLFMSLFSEVNANDEKLMDLKKQLALKEMEIERIAKDYESFAYSEWLKQMYEGVPVDPVYGGGKTEGIYRDLLLDEYGKEIVKNSKIGIHKNIAKEMKKSDSKYKQLKLRIEEYERSSK